MRELFSILRRISFFAFLVFLICKYALNIELSIWLPLGYLFILLLSWIYCKLQRRKYPNNKNTLIEYILMDDIFLPFQMGEGGHEMINAFMEHMAFLKL